MNRATVDAYDRGGVIRLFYDLENPGLSVPRQVPHRRYPWLLAGLFVLMLGALIIWTSLRGPFDFTGGREGS